ncbi:ABC transporter permease [Streptomyces sp. H39-S7]|uniref:ABC transporter permease n=1 Tax=Streptomyces sp. H39-S7 TaxID=3004357 RepID=UPI0022AFA3D1|nr:ABC transporter permease [Streptomyces sp. H39-S7]MCZ4120730.1 ABC transporter permease [Streptomyces sp. H39-S7]
MRKFDKDRLILGLAAPVLAIVAAFVLTALVLLATGKEPFHAFNVMFDQGLTSDSQIYILNKATTYYLAGIAVAIGFRMNLFNIGVDGQYRLAAFFAAVVGGAVNLPAAIQIPLIVITAMLVGAMWAGLAGVLKVTRGVSEVITTIMLNAIATAVIGYFMIPGRLAELHADTNSVSTKELPASGRFFGFDMGADGTVWGFIVIAVLVGVLYWFGLSRTRFGFDLQTVGRSESAAEASGVNVKRMVVTSMLLSGAIAGLVGMPVLLNDAHQFSTEFPVGIGFTGIAVALLGRNHPIGIALGALLWGFLEIASSKLEFEEYDKEIVGVMQGIIVLCVVIAYELVRRYGIKRQQQKVGEELAAQARTDAQQEVAA